MSDSARSAADKALDDLLQQLHRQPKAQPRPFFYTRVQARLTANAAAEKQLVPDWLRRPVYVALLGALVLGLTGDGSADASAARVAGRIYQPELLPR